MVKTYQLSKSGSFGSSIKIAPVTTEDAVNVDTCLQVNGSKEVSIQPQNVLPDLSGFEVEYVTNVTQLCMVSTVCCCCVDSLLDKK